MTEARLIRSITITSANNSIRINGAASTITPGTYWHTDDATGSDLVQALETIFAALAAPFTVHIIGVGVTDAAYATGRLQFVNGHGATAVAIDWDHADTTIDPGWLGYATTITGTTTFAASSTTRSSFVHRHGWYPQTDAEEDPVTRTLRNHVEYTTGGYADGVYWGEDERINLAFDNRPPALVEIDQGELATRSADVKTTQNDPHIAFERWALDCAAAVTESWRFYPDATATGTYKGPYRFGPGSPLWTAPLGPPTGITFRAGRYWSVVIDGQEAR